jgi:hypothetical protein
MLPDVLHLLSADFRHRHQQRCEPGATMPIAPEENSWQLRWREQNNTKINLLKIKDARKILNATRDVRVSRRKLRAK